MHGCGRQSCAGIAHVYSCREVARSTQNYRESVVRVHPGRASAASARVTDDPQASAVDKAIAWAIIHQRQGQRAKALELWRAIGAIAEPIGEVDLAARAWFSIAYLSSRRVPEQVTYLDKAIALQPNFAVAYFNRASANRELGRHEEAAADLSKSIELDSALNDLQD